MKDGFLVTNENKKEEHLVSTSSVLRVTISLSFKRIEVRKDGQKLPSQITCWQFLAEGN